MSDDLSASDEERGTGTWIVLVVLLAAAVAVAGLLFLPSDDPDEGTPAASTSAPEPMPTSASPSPEPTTPSPEPSPTEPSSAAPVEETTESALPTTPPSEHPPCTTYLDGGSVSAAEAEAALEAAAGTQFWTTSSVDLPDDLIKAVAWMESGWQSDIVACDGGTGLMQIQPETEEFINNRFERDLDRTDAEENAMLGSAQLQWLAKYFSVNYFGGDDPGSYSLEDDCGRDDQVPDYLERCLLNAVISAYQAGFGTVETALDASGDPDYPNPQYIETVRALIDQRPW